MGEGGMEGRGASAERTVPQQSGEEGGAPQAHTCPESSQPARGASPGPQGHRQDPRVTGKAALASEADPLGRSMTHRGPHAWVPEEVPSSPGARPRFRKLPTPTPPGPLLPHTR